MYMRNITTRFKVFIRINHDREHFDNVVGYADGICFNLIIIDMVIIGILNFQVLRSG